MPTDLEVIDALRALGHITDGVIEDGAILCRGTDNSFYLVLDPREDPLFDGLLNEGCFKAYGIY